MPYLPLPLPLPYTESEAFWENCRKRALTIRRCSDCNAFQHPPIPVCPVCQSWNWEWTTVSGKGRVEGFTVVTRALFPGMPVPYNVARIELEEQKGLMMYANIIDCPTEEISVDMPVEVTFEDVSPDLTMFYFKKATS